jgi:hypothetical protein
MKKTQRLLSAFVACGIALAIVSTLNAQTSQGKATVVRIKGSARYAVGNSGWKPLRVGDVLNPGTVVQTGIDQGSSVDLVLNDDAAASAQPAVFNPMAAPSATTGYSAKAEQNIVRLTENTALGIDKLTAMNTGADLVTDTQLDLKQGRILGNVKKMSAGSKYEIKLLKGVAGIRGTSYDISADGVVRVYAGTVVVAWAGDDGNVTTQVVGANQQFDARTGQVTPLAADAKDKFREFSMVAQGGGGANVPTTFTFDHTVYQVSPRKGKGPPFVPPGPPPIIPPGPPDN